MRLEALLARLEGRTVTPVTPNVTADVTEKPAFHKACTPVTSVTPKNKEAEREAHRTDKVFEYRLAESPSQWITLLYPNGADLAQAIDWARSRHGDRVLEVRPHQPAGTP